MSKSKIFLIILIVVLIVAGLFFGYRYFSGKKYPGLQSKQNQAKKTISKTGRVIDSFHTGTAARRIIDSSLFAGKNLPELQKVYER